MKEFPKLYKLDSKGKIREWSITASHGDAQSRLSYPFYSVTHGVKDGSLQTTSTAVAEGKNVGKANETSPWQQCKAEAESLWKKQRDRKGYTEDIPSEVPLRPMLAKSYDKDGHKIVWPAMTQPKLDGIRCFAKIVKGEVRLYSRTNKLFTALGHVQGALKRAVESIPGQSITLDGELYNHDYRNDFQSLVSAIRRDDPKVDTQLVEYHVYDLFAEWDFEDRARLLLTHLDTNDTVKLVDTYEVNSFEKFEDMYGEFLQAGYEGGMLRNKKGPYEPNRRSPNLQKYKDFMDEEFKIVGAYENKGKQAGQCTFECVTKEGATFGVKPKGSDAQRRQYWIDFQAGKLTGKMLTVRFFEWTTSTPPVPRFPVGVAIREDYE